jgi:hypothetical protein
MSADAAVYNPIDDWRMLMDSIAKESEYDEVNDEVNNDNDEEFANVS